MSGEDRRSQLRLLLAQGDSERMLDGLADDWPSNELQLAGDGLLRLVKGGVSRAADLARRCASDLRSRDWDGDVELADLLEAALGVLPTPLLRPIAVDLEELAMVLEGDPVHGGGRIDLRSGEVWPAAAIEYVQEAGELDADDDDDGDDDRWLWVPCLGSRDGYRDMELFAGQMDETDLGGRLERALTGRGVFRRFRDVLAESPRHLEEWYAFRDERQRGRARTWLASEGYGPSP